MKFRDENSNITTNNKDNAKLVGEYFSKVFN